MRKELLITKRILAGVAAGLVLFIYAAIPSFAKLGGPLPPSMTRVREPSSNGVWVYSKTELYEKDDYTYHGEQGGIYANWKYSASNNEHEEMREQIWEDLDKDDGSMEVTHHRYQRNSFSIPPQVLTPLEEVHLKATNDLIEFFNIMDDDWVREKDITDLTKDNCFHYDINVMYPGDFGGYLGTSPSKGGVEVKEYPGWTLRYRDTSVLSQTKMSHGRIKFSLIEPITSVGEYVITVPLGYPGDILIVSAKSFGDDAATSWYYEWEEDGTSAVSPTESGDEGDNPQNPYTQEDYTEASDKPGEDKGTGIVSEIFKKPDDSANLPGAVAIGGAGAAVAAGAVGAVGGKKKKREKTKKDDKKKEDKKEESTFKMYINKDFGNTLARDGEARYVYARIMELTSGGWEKERNDLTAQISVFSKDNSLDVSDAGMTSNGYKAAKVIVPQEGDQIQGMVSFRFAGEGGVYTRNVIFNLVGGNPVIIFPKLADDGVSWLDSSLPGEAVFIAGKGGTEKVMFYIKDALEEPIDIRFDGGPDFNVSYEKEAAYRCGYYAVVENCSPEIEKANGIIADAVTKTISVEAEFKDGTITNSEFYVQLYPDGLSVVPNTKYFKDDIFQVITVAEDNPKPGEIPIMPSSFDVLVCYVDSGTGEAKIFKNPSLSCQKPDDEGRYGNTFKENFEYRIDYTTAGGYDFYPKCTLPMFGKPYDAKMKLIYKGKNGTRLDGDLPIQFWGEIPQPPSEATRREEELKHLRRIIREFGIDNNPNLKIMLSNIEYYSASDIRFVRGYVILLGVHFYSAESRAEIRMVQLCDKYIVTCSALMKSGDYALTFILERWFGGGGKVAAAVINPFKNLLAQYIGTKMGEYFDPGGANPELEFTKAVHESFEGAMTELMTGKEKPTPEKMGVIVSFYLMSCYLRHYYNGDGKEKGDVYRSVLAAFGDLALVKLKEKLSNWIEEHSKGLMEKVAKWFGDKFKAFYGEATQKAVEAAQKQTFSNVLKDSVKNGSSTFDAAKAALNAKDAVGKITEEMQNQVLDYTSSSVFNITSESMKLSVGAVLNYILYGSNPNDMTSADPMEILLDYFMSKYGIKPENAYKVSEYTIGFNALYVNKEGNLVIGIDDIQMEFDVYNNFKVFFDMFFKYITESIMCLFSDEPRDFNNAPDYRDNMPCDTSILDKTLNELDSAKEVTYHYVGKDT